MAIRNSRSGGGIMSIIMMIAVLVGIYYLVQGLWWILGIIGPILFIVAFFLNRSVVTGWFKSIFSNFKTAPLMSVGKALLTFFAFPLVGGYLFSKAVVKNKVAEATGQMKKQQEQQYTEYEEVTETTAEVVEEDDFLDISEIEKQLDDLTVKETKRPSSTNTPKAKQVKPDPNKYDNLFD